LKIKKSVIGLEHINDTIIHTSLRYGYDMYQQEMDRDKEKWKILIGIGERFVLLNVL
jgi:hypothetical protein